MKLRSIRFAVRAVVPLSVLVLITASLGARAAQLQLNGRTQGHLFRQAERVSGVGQVVAPPALQPNPGPAVPPVVKTVPWVASNPLIAHDTWSGKTITLKGTSDVDGGAIEYAWDPGDGSAPYLGVVGNRYVIEATHAYSGLPGQTFTATLTVTDTSTGLSDSEKYYVRIAAQSLGVEVNVAIDEGLWAMHKGMTRYTSGAIEYGNWEAWSYYHSLTPANVLAFEVNGHLESGSAANPYTETVQRGLHQLFDYLTTLNPDVQPLGDPDSNNNDIAIYPWQGSEQYQSGMFMDAIIASGTPTAVAATGPADIAGRQYKDIIQDMVDYYAWSQFDPDPGSPGVVPGGWRYSPHSYFGYPADNSASQWAAIGIIPAVRLWGCTVPQWVLDANLLWLDYSQDATGVADGFGSGLPGIFGYDGIYPIFGPFGTTASGMVQLALHDLGRGNSRWDLAETYVRDYFGNTGPYYTNLKSFFYAMFAFTKSMLLHDAGNPGDGVTDPITFLQSTTAGVDPIDWYGAQTPLYGGTDSTDGIARTLVGKQQGDGTWIYTGDNSGWTSEDGSYYTAWAIVMLNRTLFESGAPVAVIKATPNPAVAFQTVQLDGSDSFHQDATKSIVLYEWDLDNDGQFDDAVGPFTTVSFNAVGTYTVRLRVTDDAGVPASAAGALNIIIATPPLAPTAAAGGPYAFCPGVSWFLNGLGSSNPDDGQSEPGQPADSIILYEWFLDGDGIVDATGPLPDVSAFFAGQTGQHIIGLQVTDNTALSFPSSGLGNLSGFDSGVVTIRDANDPECACVDDLVARAKVVRGTPTVQLAWEVEAGVHHHNVYRSTVAGGPYAKIGSTTSTYAAFTDPNVVLNTTYYYVVREANGLDEERCQSNEASVRPRSR